MAKSKELKYGRTKQKPMSYKFKIISNSIVCNVMFSSVYKRKKMKK
jgi:hypothetical protein